MSSCCLIGRDAHCQWMQAGAITLGLRGECCHWQRICRSSISLLYSFSSIENQNKNWFDYRRKWSKQTVHSVSMKESKRSHSDNVAGLIHPRRSVNGWRRKGGLSTYQCLHWPPTCHSSYVTYPGQQAMFILTMNSHCSQRQGSYQPGDVCMSLALLTREPWNSGCSRVSCVRSCLHQQKDFLRTLQKRCCSVPLTQSSHYTLVVCSLLYWW